MKKFLLAGIAAASLTSAVQAADLPPPREPVPPSVVAPVFSWTGFYVGAHFGYGWGKSEWAAFPAATFVSPSTNGIFGGGQIGYNYQINNFVLGLEGDIGYFGVQRSVNLGAAAPVIVSWRNRWDASIRGRAGVALDRTLLYVTGGVAFADLRLAASTPGGSVSETQTRTGWTVGAGVEYALTPNWTVRGEYLYANYGSKTFFSALTPPISLQTHKVRIGVNYLFSTGPSAVVARY